MSDDGATVQGVGLPSRRVSDLPGLQTEVSDVLRGAGGKSAPGPGPDQGVLARAAALRFPALKELAAREKIDALTDHIVQTAIVRGDLEELRLEAHVEIIELRERLEAIRVPNGTKPAMDAARRKIDGPAARRLDRARWLVDRCSEQIARLAGDYDAASRAYTLLSGS